MMGAPDPTPHDVAQVVRRLTPLEIDLFMGRAEGWGSWMFTAGHHLCSLGLGTERDGSISFDTPLGLAVREYLKEHK